MAPNDKQSTKNYEVYLINFSNSYHTGTIEKSKMEALSLFSREPNSSSIDFDTTLRSKFPNWNEKYYQVLLKAMEKLTQPDSKVSLTANELIRESHSSRPTWYSYFNSVEHYYRNVISTLGDVMLDHSRWELQNKVSNNNWSILFRDQKINIFLTNTRPLADYFPGLKPLWLKFYNQVLDIYVAALTSLLNLSEARTRLLVGNLINELILHPDKYYTNADVFQRYSKRLYFLFLNEQNS